MKNNFMLNKIFLFFWPPQNLLIQKLTVSFIFYLITLVIGINHDAIVLMF